MSAGMESTVADVTFAGNCVEPVFHGAGFDEFLWFSREKETFPGLFIRLKEFYHRVRDWDMPNRTGTFWFSDYDFCF